MEAPPPAYSEVDPQNEGRNNGDEQTMTAIYDTLFSSNRIQAPDTTNFNEVVAHLKLLETFSQQRSYVEGSNGMFGLPDNSELFFEKKKIEATVSELRWSVYVQRAADRFETWWLRVLDRLYLHDTIEGLPSSFHDFSEYPKVVDTLNRLPPLDVLMVWHAYMLNPRSYYEDCLRLTESDGIRLFKWSKNDTIWHANPMPWSTINAAISPNFVYDPGEEAKRTFESLVGSNIWDSSATQMKRIICPRCTMSFEIPWIQVEDIEHNGSENAINILQSLFAMRDMFIRCPACDLGITHDTLSLKQFIDDLNEYQTKKKPMPGTLLTLQTNLPNPELDKSEPKNDLLDALLSSSELSDTLMQIIVQERSPSDTKNSSPLLVLKRILNGRVTKVAQKQVFGYRNTKNFGGYIRRMLSCYWSNNSQFSQDLSAAVIRQSSFVEKMHDFDWLHSPALKTTIKRAIVRYSRFMDLIAEKNFFCVPTLDIDLVWHTHQLTPSRYLYFTTTTTGTLINHDDKVPQTQLSNAFENTAKLYERKYKQMYSECLCWYCEAVRDKIKPTFGSGVSSEHLYNTIGKNEKIVPGAHISTHNAVKDTSSESNKTLAQIQYESSLWSHYNKAYERANKRARSLKRPMPPKCVVPEYYWYGAYYPWTIYAAMPGCYGAINGFGVGYGNCLAGTCSPFGGGSCGAAMSGIGGIGGIGGMGGIGPNGLGNFGGCGAFSGAPNGAMCGALGGGAGCGAFSGGANCGGGI